MKEIWKPLAPFTKTYKGVTTEYDLSDTHEISNTGKIRHKHSGRERKLRFSNRGYMQVMFKCKDGKHLMCSIHRLVAITFLDNPYNKKTVNHIDGDKTNNRVDNLQWATLSEQHKHAYTNGLSGFYKLNNGGGNRGEQNTNSKLTEDGAKEIRQLRAKNPKKWTYGKLAKKYEVNKGTIASVIKYKTWAHV